ncbi:hypothetical protein Pcinc_024653, partial [Petrolisthes cinctipes]
MEVEQCVEGLTTVMSDVVMKVELEKNNSFPVLLVEVEQCGEGGGKVEKC